MRVFSFKSYIWLSEIEMCVFCLYLCRNAFFSFSLFLGRNVCFACFGSKMRVFCFFLCRNECFFASQVRLCNIRWRCVFLSCIFLQMHVFCLFLGRKEWFLFPRVGEVMSSINGAFCSFLVRYPCFFSFFYWNVSFSLLLRQKYGFFASQVRLGYVR